LITSDLLIDVRYLVTIFSGKLSNNDSKTSEKEEGISVNFTKKIR